MSDVIIIIVLLKMAAAVLKGERDTIQFKPDKSWFLTPFWINKTKWKNWVWKYLLAPLADGWHLVEYLQILCYDLIITVLWYRLYGDEWAILYIPLLLQGIHWIWFHFSYEK